jgi:nitrate reductase beta subunit
MVWYVPPLWPIQSHANAGAIDTVGEIPDMRSLRIPVRYLANLLTAGAEAPIVSALGRMLAMRIYSASASPARVTARPCWRRRGFRRRRCRRCTVTSP